MVYVDTVLPFGIRSSPKIFNCIADALQWIAKRRGISYHTSIRQSNVTYLGLDSIESSSLMQTPFIKNRPKLHYVLQVIKSGQAKKDSPQQKRLPEALMPPNTLTLLHKFMLT